MKKILNKFFKKESKFDYFEFINDKLKNLKNQTIDSEDQILSVYDQSLLSFEEKIFFKILNELVLIYKPKFIYKNKFDYITEVDEGSSFDFLFKYKYPSDCYPIISYLNNKNKNYNTTIDIGANRGEVAIFLAKNSQSVLAFEPVDDNIQKFKNNIELNRYSNIEIIPNVVSDSNGEMDFYLYESNGHHSLGKLGDKDPKEVKKVKSITLDNFAKERGLESIDILKVDVEGFELNVFKGAESLLKEQKIKCIIFEISKLPLEQFNFNAVDIYKYLKKQGYEIFNLLDEKISEEYFDQIFHEDLAAYPKK